MRKQIMYEVFDRKFNLKVVLFQLQSIENFPLHLDSFT